MEQYAKVKVVIERTYLIPLKDGKSFSGNTAEEQLQSWFGDPLALNSYQDSFRYRLGGSDTIISAEIFETVDVPDGTI